MFEVRVYVFNLKYIILFFKFFEGFLLIGSGNSIGFGVEGFGFEFGLFIVF